MSFSVRSQMRIALLVLAAVATAIPAAAQMDFYTITPCRAYDSRGPGGPLEEGTTYTESMVEPAVNCGVPADAVAISVNVTIIGASKTGYLEVFAAGTTPPLAAVLSFSAGRTLGMFEMVLLGTGANNGELSFLATMPPPPPTTGTYHIAFDVTGYFLGPKAVADDKTVTEDDPATMIDVLANDFNPNGETLTIGSVDDTGTNGTVVIAGDNLSLTYQPDPDYCNTPPGTTLDTFTYTIAPGGTTATVTVTVTCENDPPVVTTTAGTTSFTEDGGPVVVDSGVTVTDVDNPNLASATVTITNALDGAAETLAATSCAGLTVTPGNPLTITGSQPLATYQTCLQSVTYDNTSQNPDPTSRVIEFVVNDGTANSAAASKTVTVGGGADAPVVTTTAGTTAFTEGGGAVVVDAGVTVTDPDDTDLESATVSLASAPDGASEVLSATSCAGLTVTPGNPLTITGSQPLATYQACLQSVTYNNTSQNPTAGNRAVNFVANDGDSNSNTASKTVSVAAVNNAPVVTTTAGTTAFTENAGAVVVDSGVTVTDADDVNLESATVSLASAPDGASEVLSATSCAGLTVTPGNPLTITGSQPLATYQACLQSVTYNNTSETPDETNRTVNFVVNDGDNNSNTASKTVSVAAVNDLPVVTTTAGITAFVEDAGAVVVDNGVTVTDADDANLESATVSLVSAPNGASEVLSATSCAGLTVTPGNPLTITGSQPVAVYQACLQSVTYNNTSQAPNTANRTVNFVVNDGDNNSNTASKTVSVASVNDLPVVTTTAGITPFVEDAGAVVVDNGLTITDADDVNLESATVSLAAAPDGASEVLSATSCAGLTVTPGNPLTVTGSQPLATYQTCLRSVTYNNTSQSPNTTNRTVNFLVNDGDNNSNTAPKTVSVTAANDLPVVTTTAGITAFVEDAGAVVVDNGVTVTDADDANLESATVSLAAAPDGASEVLSATSCAGLTVTPGNPLTITGSQPVAVYQTCLQSVTYNNSSQSPNTANRTVNFVVNDGDNNSNTAPKTVSVTSVNDLPVVTTTAGITSFVEDAGAVAVDNLLTVTDVDDTNLESATVSLVAAPDGASEVLSATSCAGLTVTPGNPLTITGSQPVAVYQTCLRSVTYNNASQNPDTTNRTVNFVVNDGDDNSNTASKTVSVTAVNDPPVPQVNPVSYATAGNTQLHVEGKVLDGVVSISDTQGVDAKAVAFTDPDGPVPPAIVNNDAGVSANGGSFDIDPDGSFTYVPPAGFTGTDSFIYQVTDTVTPFNATVNIVVTEMVWYVHDVVAPGNPGNPAAGDTGRSNNAFEVLQDAINAAGPDDYVFVFRGNTGGTPHAPATLTNKDGLKLIGQGFGLSVPGYPGLVAAGVEPNEAVIQNAAATGAEDNALQVTINAGTVDAVEIRGFAITATDNAIDVTVSGAATAGVTISHNQIGTTAMEGIDVNHGSTSTASTFAVHDNVLLTGGNAIDVARTNGTLKITAFDDNAVSGDTNASGIVVTGPNVSFDSVPGSGALDPVSGGTTVIGASNNPVASSGMILSQVSGSLSFTDLDIYAGGTSGSGLAVLGTGAFTGVAGTSVQVTPAAPDGIGTGTIDSDNGAAVDISSATIDLRLANLQSNTSVAGLSLNTVGANSQFRAPSGSAIVKTSGAGTAFSVASSGTGTTVSYAGTLNVTSGAGVSLTNNGGSTISFTGLLTLSTGANAAFAATGGGTVTSTDTSSTLATGSGTALTVTDTTIGALGLKFRSISAGSSGTPANGIVLNNSGTGALTVAGTGSAGSGGTIQATSSDGVRLTNAHNVSLSYMNFTNIASGVSNGGCHFENVVGCEAAIDMSGVSNIILDDLVIDHNDAGHIGIAGNNVNGLSLTDSSVLDVGESDAESGILLQQAIGTVLLEDLTVDDPVEYGIRVFQPAGTGTLNMTLRRVTVQNNINTFGEAGFSIRAAGGTSRVLVDDCDFVNTDGPGVDGQSINAAVLHMTVQGSTFTENRALPMAVNFVTDNTSQGFVKISNNSVTDCATAANCSIAFDLDANRTSTLHAIVTNNTVASGSGIGTGMEFIVGDGATGRAEIRDNNFVMPVGEIGMTFQARSEGFGGTNGRLDVTFEGNTISGIQEAGLFTPGVQFLAGSSTGTHDQDVCVNTATSASAGGNTITGTNNPGFTPRFEVTQRTGTTFILQGFAGTGTNAGSVGSHFDTNNNATTLDPTFVRSTGTAIVSYTSGVCNTPTTPTLP